VENGSWLHGYAWGTLPSLNSTKTQLQPDFFLPKGKEITDMDSLRPGDRRISFWKNPGLPDP